MAGGFEEPKDDQPAVRRTRIPVAEFAAAVRIGTHADARSRVDIDEVECLLSNLIYKVSSECLFYLLEILNNGVTDNSLPGSHEGLHCS